ncbi:MAG: prolipoprotein diacylglyceryl transferase [Bacteroidaceae bacterium]|nr:prolipoprotein diacylglyceryl transferase [Bacteroidaceae bacterium]
MLNYITWTVNPAIYSGVVDIRWYGLLFAIGFAIGYYIVNRMFRLEGKPTEWVDTLLIYLVIATLIGSRLGHCLFYQWDYYSQHPIDILKVWEGGLASHGGTIGIIIAMWIYSRRVTHTSILWILDRICVPIALVGSLIRVGNLMNHELYGHATDAPWAFRFITNIPQWMNGAEPIFSVPSHPTQIYEALTYLTLFVILILMYRHKAYRREGLLLGVFFIGTFLSRIFIEIIKNATVYMGGIGDSFKMGQLLSIPFVIAGIWLVVRALRRPSTKG